MSALLASFLEPAEVSRFSRILAEALKESGDDTDVETIIRQADTAEGAYLGTLEDRARARGESAAFERAIERWRAS